MSRLIFISCLMLLSSVSLCVAAVDASSTTNFALTLRVEKGEFDGTVADLESLMAHAKDRKMLPNTIMFLRGCVEKVQQAIAKKAEADQKEALKSKKIETGPIVFTNETIAVKSLKAASASSKKKGKGGIPVYKAKEVEELLAKKKLNLKQPFLISGGVDQLDTLKSLLTAPNFIDNLNVEVKYLSPVVAKKKRTFDQPQQQQAPEDQMEYSVITLEKYFRNCFNYKAKPDFKKTPGSDTEHCEQNLAAAVVDAKLSNFSFQSVSPLNSLLSLETGRKWFSNHSSELASMIPDDLEINNFLSTNDVAFVVLGPAGSGEQLRQEKKHFVDGLVHGKRRWFFMTPENFGKLREVGKEVLEPASAFMFFEQQLGELKEEHGLGEVLPFSEVVQQAGDLLYVPGDLIQTSLSLEDSVSMKTYVVETKEAAIERVGKAIWAPESGVIPNGYTVAACYGFDFDTIPIGPKLNSMQANIISQILKQYYPSAKAQNSLILTVLQSCSGLLASPDFKKAADFCQVLWPACTKRLALNLDQIGQKLPAWLSTIPTPTSVMSSISKSEL